MTERQAEVLAFIEDHYHANGTGPTYREIASRFGVSLSTAYGYVRQLEARGRLRLVKGEKRNIYPNSVCEKCGRAA